MNLINFLFIFLFSVHLWSNAVNLQYKNIQIVAAQKDEKIAKIIATNLDQDIADFQKKIGFYDDEKINILIAKNADEYLSWTKNHATIIEFSDAFYSNHDKVIYLKNIRNLHNLTKIRTIILHEYIHHFINNHANKTPLWFNEGMAVYFSGGWNLNREFNFIKNYFLGNTVPLEMMKYGYPKNQIEWGSFYAKSTLALKYLVINRQKSFFSFWDCLEQSKDFNSAFNESFFFTQKDFSALFEEYARNHFHAEVFMASSSVIWGILPIVLIIGFVRKKIKNRKIVKNWQAIKEIKDERI